MKDHEIAALVNELRDIAINYHDTQQLRSRIAGVVVPLLKQTPSADYVTARLAFSAGQIAGCAFVSQDERLAEDYKTICKRAGLLPPWRDDHAQTN